MKLAQRRLLVAAGALVGAVGLVFLAIVLPINNYRESLAREVRAIQGQKIKLMSLEGAYAGAREAQARLSQNYQTRPADFTLFAFLENLATRDQVRPNIEFLRPSVKKIDEQRQEEVVDMRLTDIGLERLTTYLYHIESAPEAVRIKRFILRTNTNRGVDVDLVLSTLSKPKS